MSRVLEYTSDRVSTFYRLKLPRRQKIPTARRILRPNRQKFEDFVKFDILLSCCTDVRQGRLCGGQNCSPRPSAYKFAALTVLRICAYFEHSYSHSYAYYSEAYPTISLPDLSTRHYRVYNICCFPLHFDTTPTHCRWAHDEYVECY